MIATTPSVTSTTKSCKSKARIFPSGKQSVVYFLNPRRVIRLSVSKGRFEFSCRLLTRTLIVSADVVDPVSSGSIGDGGDVAMGVIETSLAALQTGSALITNVPFIASFAGLIIQALQMRGVRFDSPPYTSPLSTTLLIGSEAVQRRMGFCDGETRRRCEYRHRCWGVVPGTRPCRRRPPRGCAQNIEVPSQVCLAYTIRISLSDVCQAIWVASKVH
jgi:hypothetical protein